MQPESLKLLADMQQAVNDIADFTRNRSLEDFAADKQMRMAVERAFEIVGEALAQLRKIDPTTIQRITDAHAIIGFRNVLIHGYGRIDHGKMWDIVQTELPTLRQELDALLK